MPDFQSLSKEIADEVAALRHDIHAHPELCFEEVETAQRVVEFLKPIKNLQIETGIAKTGVVATLNADKPGPCVALRSELDALPIHEETGATYASRIPGKMHACGHDGHTACLAGAVKVLSQMADQLPGCVKFFFQPAEEGGGGGEVMCREGVLDARKVDAIFACHGWPDLPLGTVGIRGGPSMASADFWKATIRGVGGHAAYPHRTIDPIVVASHTVTALQSITARNVDPLRSSVVTVACIAAGKANNVIPETAVLEGTIRTLDSEVRTRVLRRFEEIVSKTAEVFGASAEISMGDGYPVLVNDDVSADFVRDVARDAVGPDRVDDSIEACMGGEDFAFFAQRIPAAFWRLGVCRGPIEDQPMLHQSTYDFPDAVIPTAVQMHCEIAESFLRGRA